MKKRNKTILLAGAAAGILGLGLSGPALAFDTVNWDWEKVILENVAIDGQVNLNLNPSGMVELEKLQFFIGDAIATSTVNGVYNMQPSQGGDTTVSFTVDWSGYHDDLNPANFGTGVVAGPPGGPEAPGPEATLSGDLTGTGSLIGTIDEGTDATALTATFTDIAVSVAPSGSYDSLTELPEVASAATAVGNNQSIVSDVALTLHDAQFVFGGVNPDARTDSFQGVATGNSSLSAALAFAQAGAQGLITPSSISATSTVSDIWNASVDSNATAVGTKANIEVNGGTPDDALVVADYVQGAYANVSALSSVSGVTVNSYTNLGVLNRPLVNSVATAVGNNLSIKVTSPTGP